MCQLIRTKSVSDTTLYINSRSNSEKFIAIRQIATKNRASSRVRDSYAWTRDFQSSSTNAADWSKFKTGGGCEYWTTDISVDSRPSLMYRKAVKTANNIGTKL